MNLFAPPEYVESIRRLALGVEPIDALQLGRIRAPFDVSYDASARGLPRPSIDRHSSCLYALVFGAGVATPVEIRLSSPDRRYVPRRISYPIPAEGAAGPAANRIRRPRIFPGANYPIDSGATGLRGRVERNLRPVRWTRVEARVAGAAEPLARAHGDDRGEFLLVLPPHTSLAALEATWPLQVTVFERTVPAPAPVPPDLPSRDPLWDLPPEGAPAAGNPDPVSAGTSMAGFTARQTQPVDFVPGRVVSQVTFTIV